MKSIVIDKPSEKQKLFLTARTKHVGFGRVAPRCLTADEAEHKRVPRSMGNAGGLSPRRPSGTANGGARHRGKSFFAGGGRQEV